MGSTDGGEGEVRTPDTVARMPHFECGAWIDNAHSRDYTLTQSCRRRASRLSTVKYRRSPLSRGVNSIARVDGAPWPVAAHGTEIATIFLGSVDEFTWSRRRTGRRRPRRRHLLSAATALWLQPNTSPFPPRVGLLVGDIELDHASMKRFHGQRLLTVPTTPSLVVLVEG